MRKLQTQLSLPLMAIILEGFLSRLSFGVISFALPLYAYRLGLSLTQIGLLMSLDTVIAIVLKPLMGWAADRFGLKRMFTIAIVLRSMVALLLAGAGVPWQLYGIRVAHGLASSLRDPSSNALIAEHGGEKAVASAFAWYHTAKSVAGAMGKTVAGILLAATLANFSLVFLAAFALSALPLLVVVVYVKDVVHVPAPTPVVAVTRAQLWHQLQQTRANWRAILPLIGFGFLISSTAEMLRGMFPILATQYAGLSEAQTGMIYTASILVILISGPLFGWLADHVNGKFVLMVRSVANTISSIVFIVAPNVVGIAAGKIVDDTGKAAFRPAWGALMAHVSGYDRRRRAQTMSLMTMGEDAGEIIGPVLAGFLWSTWGIAIALAVRAALAITTEIYAFFLVRTLAPPITRPAEPAVLPANHLG